MNLFDVNVLVYAFRQDAERHPDYRAWLLELINGEAAFGVAEQVLAGFIRITTHPRIFRQPSGFHESLAFARTLREHPLCRLIRPSRHHWSLFIRLSERAEARGNLVTGSWFAALAIESGCTWVTADRDFARFPGLRWRHPLDHASAIENPG